MEWFSLVSTAVGVLLGVGATTFNERLKYKRDRSKARYEARAKLYADYLTDLAKTRDAIRLVARSDTLAEQARVQAADTAFTAGNINARRYQIRITSSNLVADASTKPLRALRALRDAVAHDQYESPAYNVSRDRYEAILAELMTAMAEDLKTLE